MMDSRPLEGALMNVLTDAFNRAINALEKAGAIDMSEMRNDYTGVGSKYYDLVTREFEYTLRYATQSVREAVLKESGSSGDGS